MRTILDCSVRYFVFVFTASFPLFCPGRVALGQQPAPQAPQTPPTPTPRNDSLAPVRVLARLDSAGLAMPNVDAAGTRFGRRTERLDPRQSGTPALNNSRQAFAQAAGVMVWEQDMSGVQTSIGLRGLSPNRSWELNTRQDGADIASDPIGYPEAYYTPPLEAVERIELVRGGAALQHGPQLGGMLNYVMRRGRRDAPFAVEAATRGGTGNLMTTHVAAGGQVGTLNWHGYVNTRQGDGWRAFNEFRQATQAIGAEWRVRDGTSLRATLTHMAYRLRQPGGLTDAQFAADPRQALRPRDWFSAPWTVPQLTLEHRLGAATTMTASAFGLYGERNSVGVIAGPLVPDSGRSPRRLDRDAYRNVGAEVRVVHGTTLLGHTATLAAGGRWSLGRTTRLRARGEDGAEFGLQMLAPPTLDLAFDTRNAAAFAELGVEIAPGLTVSPGLRVERISMQSRGAWRPASGTTFLATGAAVPALGDASHLVPLGALGVSWQLEGAEVYGNVSQSFRPVTFAEQFPNDLVAVDPALRHARGVSADVGVRRTVGRVLTFDVGAFWLQYANRVGVVSGAALGADSVRFPAGIRRNVGQSTHYGAEVYGALDVAEWISAGRSRASVQWWTAASRIVAVFTGGPLAGKQVEYAPDWVVRSGLTWRTPQAQVTIQGSYVDGVWSDASNTRSRSDGVQGWIPSYRVVDVSVRAPLFRRVSVEASVNNVLDARYFTRRATGYPGPGIVPADGRVLVAGLVIGR